MIIGRPAIVTSTTAGRRADIRDRVIAAPR